MITAEKVFKVVENFKKALQVAQHEGAVSMLIGIKRSSCGTVACHAGWYALSRHLEGRTHRKAGCTYYGGAILLRSDLGLGEWPDKWANRNPDIWGNDRGSYMFSDPIAFSKSKTTITLQAIVDWWEDVAWRLLVLENAPEEFKDSKIA